MQIIKLDATDSTNVFLKNRMLKEVLEDFTVVTANEQLKGRGQMGTAWQSEAGKNLIFSVLKKFDNLHAKDRFLLNVAASQAVYASLKNLQIPNLSIKWPNDILSGNSKICGILIENILNHQNIQTSIIGIGLNVNQLTFNNLPRVSSMKLLTGRTWPLDELLQSLLIELKNTFEEFEGKGVTEVCGEYEKLLFRKNKPSTFKDSKGELFMGFIRGITKEGKLKVELEDTIFKDFDLKEIRLLY